MTNFVHASRTSTDDRISESCKFVTDDRKRLARLPLTHPLDNSGLENRASRSRIHAPMVVAFQYYLHLELPHVKVLSIELVDASERCRGVHGGCDGC